LVRPTALGKQWALASEQETPSAEDFGIKDASVEASSLLPDLEIKHLDLRNILVDYHDSSAAIDTSIVIRKLTADSKEIDLNKEIVRLGKVTLAESDSQILLEKVASTPNVQAEADTTSDSSSTNWVVSADRLAIDRTDVWF